MANGLDSREGGGGGREDNSGSGSGGATGAIVENGLSRRSLFLATPGAAAALWGGIPVSNAAASEETPGRVPLGKGKGSISVPEMGTGTWAWGDGSVWGYGGYDKSLSDASIKEAFRECLNGGVTLFDTAEVYGTGTSERMLGNLIKAATPEERSRVQVATKFYPTDPSSNLPRMNVAKDLVVALDASLARLGLESVDLYQIHAPLVAASPEAVADALAEAVKSGNHFHPEAVGPPTAAERPPLCSQGESSSLSLMQASARPSACPTTLSRSCCPSITVSRGRASPSLRIRSSSPSSDRCQINPKT